MVMDCQEYKNLLEQSGKTLLSYFAYVATTGYLDLPYSSNLSECAPGTVERQEQFENELRRQKIKRKFHADRSAYRKKRQEESAEYTKLVKLNEFFRQKNSASVGAIADTQQNSEGNEDSDVKDPESHSDFFDHKNKKKRD
ncbi:unnamed protein product [Caenorhabditis brenneri]